MPRRAPTAEELVWKDNLKRVWLAKKTELGLTQDKLAEEMGFKSQGAISGYMNGTRPLNTDAKIKFAKALKVDVREIDPSFMVEQDAQPVKPQTSQEALKLFSSMVDEMSDDELLKLAGGLETIVHRRRGDQEG